MQTYNYVVKHIPGAKNIADALSRLLSSNEQKPVYNETEEYLRLIVDEATPVSMNINEIEQSSENDEEFDGNVFRSWYMFHNIVVCLHPKNPTFYSRTRLEFRRKNEFKCPVVC
jgi:hypothetical protein